jgi:16S rRNA processing protein RimM
MDRLAVGRIGAAHGLLGTLKVKSLSGETGHFLGFKRIFVLMGGRFVPYTVEQVEPYKDGVLLKLAGVDTREQGDRLRGLEIWVDRENASTLAEGEYYLADLCRCRVYQAGQEIGKVVSVCDGAKADFLEIERPSGQRLLVPFSEPFVGEVDIERGSISLDESFEAP